MASKLTSSSSKDNTTEFERIIKRIAGIKPTDKLTESQRSDLFACAIKNIVAFGLLLITTITIFIALYRNEKYSDNYFKYMIFIVLPIIVSSYLLLPVFSQKMSTPFILLMVFLFILFVLALYAFYRIKNPESVVLVQYSIYLFFFVFTIVGLAIIYKFSIRYIYNTRGIFSIVLQFIFFIPCLLIDLIEYIKNDLKFTPPTTYILLGLEALILFVYFILIPGLYSTEIKTNAQILLNDAVFLNQETKIGDKAIFLIDIDNTINTRQNFAISFWTFINNNTIATPIFRIGDKHENIGKLNIVSGMDGKFWFTLSNTPNNPSSIKRYLLNNDIIPTEEENTEEIKPSLPIQKWNHISISIEQSIPVENTTVNVFLNGQINNSYKLDGHVFDFAKEDVIITGVNMPGTNLGAICNVCYYRNPITKDDASAEYNALRYKNPPIQNTSKGKSKYIPYLDTIKREYNNTTKQLKEKYNNEFKENADELSNTI
jgi:hypothetical protein